jgi:uncharacterized metal-binding protein
MNLISADHLARRVAMATVLALFAAVLAITAFAGGSPARQDAAVKAQDTKVLAACFFNCSSSGWNGNKRR